MPLFSVPLIGHTIIAVFASFTMFWTLSARAQIVLLDQGPSWTASSRHQFYTEDQGSRIMSLAWMRALVTPSGAGFLDDSLTRYGYLANPNGPEADIPVGFSVALHDGEQSIGMTCSACHTRQIDVNGTHYRIDGGPAMVDFQSLLVDLDGAVASALATDGAFDAFAEKAVGVGASEERKQALRVAVELWHLRFNTLTIRALPNIPWGPGRLDAISMIFNRLTGLDIGEPPSYLIPENIQRADAPTRYPFLWNAARQDMTQWPGFAQNGNDIFGLARNLGEVYGVFGVLRPTEQSGLLRLNRDYLSHNSADFDGLLALEDLIWKIGPPKWPWEVDQALADAGEAIFNRAPDDGGCAECHKIQTGAFRSPVHRSWKTPIIDVGTDNRECSILARTVQTGVLEGAKIPFLTDEIQATDTAFNVLTTAVLGSIVQNATRFQPEGLPTMGTAAQPLPPELQQLRDAFQPVNPPTPSLITSVNRSGCAYGSRVLQGIWATAPYLHNGSVPTLDALLKPTAERPASFKLGPNYDIEAVGLAVDQTSFDYTLQTTGCSDVTSGNSRCGHEYGMGLTDADRDALLEYLKTL